MCTKETKYKGYILHWDYFKLCIILACNKLLTICLTRRKYSWTNKICFSDISKEFYKKCIKTMLISTADIKHIKSVIITLNYNAFFEVEKHADHVIELYINIHDH